MALTDDVTRLTEILVRQHQDGQAARLRLQARLSLGDVGKACGVSGEQVAAWEAALSKPTTQEGLAWMSLLWARQPGPLSRADQAAAEARDA